MVRKILHQHLRAFKGLRRLSTDYGTNWGIRSELVGQIYGKFNELLRTSDIEKITLSFDTANNLAGDDPEFPGWEEVEFLRWAWGREPLDSETRAYGRGRNRIQIVSYKLHNESQ